MATYDVIVAGAGPAGLTAALFAARCGRSTLVLAPEGPGGAVVSIQKIEDFPGFPEGIPGYDLGPLMHEQAMGAGAEFELAELTELRRDGDDWTVAVGGTEHTAAAVVVATGTRARALDVPRIHELTGRGVSHCASCDGPLFRGRAAGVVGAGDSGLFEALELVNHVASVVVFEREESSTAQETYRQRVEESDLAEVHYQTVVEELLGDSALTGVRTRNVVTGDVSEVPLDSLFVYIGREPNTEFLDGLLALDPERRIPVDVSMQTEVPGLFAAGDVCVGGAAQAVAAAGSGATAALAAHRWLAR